MRPISRSFLALSCCLSLAPLALRADDQDDPHKLAYCTAATLTGKLVYGSASAGPDVACANATATLAATNDQADLLTYGFLRDDEEVVMALRCTSQDRLYTKMFTGVGLDPLQRAVQALMPSPASCVAGRVGDEVRTTSHYYAGRPVKPLSFGPEVQRDLIDLDRALRAGADPATLDLPSLTVDAATHTIRFHAPQSPAYLMTPAGIKALHAGFTAGTKPDDSVLEGTLGAQDPDAPPPAPETPSPALPAGSGGMYLRDATLPPPDPAVANETYDSPPAEKVAGDKSKVAFGVGAEAHLKRMGDGTARAFGAAWIFGQGYPVFNTQLETKRSSTTDSSGATIDKITVTMTAAYFVLNKRQTIDFGAPKELTVGKTVPVPKTVWFHQDLIKTTPYTFLVGPVPVTLTGVVTGVLGRKDDQYQFGLAPDDITSITASASFSPYLTLSAGVDATILPEDADQLVSYYVNVQQPKMNVEITLIDDTVAASVAYDTRGTGPCADIHLNESTPFNVTVSFTVGADLTPAAVADASKVIKDYCDGHGTPVSAPAFAPRARPMPRDCGFPCIGGGGGGGGISTGSAGTLVGKIGDQAGQVAGQAGAVIGSGLDQVKGVAQPIADGLKKACDAASDAVDNAGHMEFQRTLYDSGPIHIQDDSQVKWFEVDSCKQRPATTTITICNQHPTHATNVAYATTSGSDGLVLKGWTRIPANACAKIADLGHYKGDAYLYARAENSRLEWSGKDRALCGTTGSAFTHNHADTMACTGGDLQRLNTFKMTLKEGANKQDLSDDMPEVQFCNQTDYETLSGAVGYFKVGDMVATGWSAVPRGKCVPVLAKAFGDIYGFATNDRSNYFKRWPVSGDRAFCTQRNEFVSLSSDHCAGTDVTGSFGMISGTAWKITGAGAGG